jgi:hypothetical protein
MMKDIDIDNVGIMSGFTEDFDSTLAEALSDEGLGGEEEGYETGKIMDRKPDSPEILMNNLRGDMRSVDARREELADMVGYGAAMETPDEVLTILQDHFAMMDQGPAMGIGALPEAPQQPAPPPMAQGPAFQQPPINMAKGGYVQNFALGSDEDGVTPATDTSGINLPPAMAALAQQNVGSFLSRKPSEVPDLQSAMEKRMPIYEELLGGDDDMTQAQALLELSKAAFGWAGGKSFGEAASGAAAGISKLAGEKTKADRAIKVAALNAAEKDLENTRSTNTKLLESQRKMWGDLYTESLKATGSNWFGKGSGEYNIINQPGFVAKIAQGLGTTAENNLFNTAYSRLEGKAKPTINRYTDDRGKLIEETIPGVPIPQFVVDAKRMFDQIQSGSEVEPIVPETKDEAVAKIENTTGQPVETETEDQGPRYGDLTATQTKVAYPEWGRNQTDPSQIKVRAHNYYRPGERTLYNVITGDLTGREVTGVSRIPEMFSRLPLIGDVIADPARQEDRTFVQRSVENELVSALRTNPKFVDKERSEIKAELGLDPALFDNTAGWIARAKGVEQLIRDTHESAVRTINSETANKSDIDAAKKVIEDTHNALRVLGMKLEFTNDDYETVKRLPVGTPYWVNGKKYTRK